MINAACLFTELVIVVPTRNRADLAVRAIGSALTAEDLPWRVLVSDNSTDKPARAELREFCGRHDGERLRLIAPPEPLAMTPHYDWAFARALEMFPAANHFTLLTDRMVFRPGELAALTTFLAAYPGRIVAYNHDRVDDFTPPVKLERVAWGSGAWELPSSLLLDLASRAILSGCFPHLMNSVVPRGVFEALRARYGNLFASVAPDYNFCFRSLEMVDSILYYDRSPLIGYALRRSNGESQARGIASNDHLDFMAELKGKSYSHAAPIPEVQTVGNAIINEYCVVRGETGSAKLPPVDPQEYLRMLAGEVSHLEHPALREQMLAVLRAHGWTATPPAGRGGLRAWLGKLSPILSRAATLPLWMWLARRFGMRPPVRFHGFASLEDALASDRAHPLPACAEARHLKDWLALRNGRLEDHLKRVPVPPVAAAPRR